MSSMKVLITSGCSLSDTMDYDRTDNEPWKNLKVWPIWVEEHFKPEVAIHSGLGSTGNDLISKKAIYHCTQQLKKHNAEDICLVVAWSRIDRNAKLVEKSSLLGNVFYNERNKQISERPEKKNHTWVYQFSDYSNNVNENDTAWVYFNVWKYIKEVDYYYGYFQEHINMMENTLWNMLAVKSFCELHNIKYVWTTIDDSYMEEQHIHKHWSISHLYDSIKTCKGRMLQCSMAKYIKDTANNTDIQYVQNDGVHLGTLGHKMISEDIIIPYIAHYETN
jgi:hypothetical protein